MSSMLGVSSEGEAEGGADGRVGESEDGGGAGPSFATMLTAGGVPARGGGTSAPMERVCMGIRMIQSLKVLGKDDKSFPATKHLLHTGVQIGIPPYTVGWPHGTL